MKHSELQESFWEACKRGDNNAISWFVRLGADVTAWSNTAIKWAAEYGHTDTVKLLVQLGADVRDAIRWAKEMKRRNAVKTLEEGLNESF